MSRRYVLLDVFTDRPLAGNPLAVVLDSDGLDGARMQEIAREFNLSETVFVLPPKRPVHRAAVRIFTPSTEVPFAGHPTIGTAVLLALEDAGQNPSRHEAVIVLEEEVGPIRCGVTVKTGSAGHAIFDAPRRPARSGNAAGKEAIAAALGLVPAEIGFENHEPTVYGAGLSFAYVPIADLVAIGKATPMPALWREAFGTDVVGAFLYCRETTQSGRHFHARMFGPETGVWEDPATGSAAAAFAGVILQFDQPPGGSHRYAIEQGIEMGRPSLIRLEVDIDGAEVVTARIGGDAVLLARGTLEV